MKKLLISILGGLVFLFILTYVATPFLQRQFYSMGANNQIKKDERCAGFKFEYINALANKSDVSAILDRAKKDSCHK